MDEDEFLFDDDLNDDATLDDLEQSALLSTQRAPPASTANTKKQYGHTSVLNRAGSSSRNIPWRPPQPVKNVPKPQSEIPPDPPSSDYGLDDEEVIDLDEPSMVIQPASGMQSTSRPAQHAPSGPRRSMSRSMLDPETEAAFAAADAEMGAPNSRDWEYAPHLNPQASGNTDTAGLAARIAQLEAEQTRLRNSEQEARSAALAKQGEISIVRANQEKAIKEYERRIAVIQKLHADETAKQKADLDASRKEKEKMETDNRFLQHDLAQDADKTRRIKGPVAARVGATAREAGTPKKAKRTGLGDGFDDDEVRMVSPSKSKDRTRDGTPRHGNKRKRSAQDSPAPVLSFTQPAPPERQDSINQSNSSFPSSAGYANTIPEDDRYEFMQRILNHRSRETKERTLEELAKYTLPSAPTQSLSSILMNHLASSQSSNESSLCIQTSRGLLEIWHRCLSAEYFAPLHLILDLLRFAVCFELSSVVSQLIEQALPLCIRSIDLIAYPLTRASLSSDFAASLDREDLDARAKAINVDEVLIFLQQLCQAASLSLERLETFWQIMELTFVLQMLNKALPLPQITIILSILKTSALPTTFGIITSDTQNQARHETAIIDRLTGLLFETPQVPTDEPPYTEIEIAELRLQTLDVFKTLCITDHGSLLLAQHRSAIGRLIRFLDGQVNKLYTLPHAHPSKTTRTPNETSAHALTARSINTTIHLLHSLLTAHENIINIPAKLQVIHGGYLKFLISMTRIAFSEQLVYEYGLSDEVADAAHMILDGVLSPEEGEAVVRAVETPMGTRGTSIRDGVRGAEGTHEGDVTMSE